MPNDQVDRIQAKLSSRLAMAVVSAITYAHNGLHHIKHRLAMAVFHSISDEISEEVDITMGPWLEKLFQETPEDHPAYPAVNFFRHAHGQLKALAGTGLQISGLLGSVSAILNNDLAPFVYNIVGAQPAQLPDVATIVQSYVTQLVGHDEALHDIAAQGIQFGWGDRMLALGYTRPDTSTVLEMFRRGMIVEEDALSYLAWNGITSHDAAKILQLADIPVSPADAALAVLRGNMTEAEGVKVAAESGIDAASFQVLIGNTGEPPGLMQLLEAFRRGFIDQATLERGILQSRYRNEWIPTLEKLRYSPMSASDAVRAAVQNQISADEARSIADQDGLQPGHFDILLNTEGNPLSRTEMEELFNRGLVSETEVKQAIRESRTKNKYVDLAFQLHQKLIPEGTIARAMRYGAISHAEAVSKVAQLGYSDADSAIIVTAASGERIQVHKDQVVTSVATMYSDGIVSRADAESTILGLGFSADEVKFTLEAADFKREAHTVSTVVSAVKSKFISHHITSQQASGFLDKIGIAASQRDYLMELWTIEQTAYVKILTPAQIVKAVKLQLITPDDGLARLVDQGYSDGDAKLLIEGA